MRNPNLHFTRLFLFSLILSVVFVGESAAYSAGNNNRKTPLVVAVEKTRPAVVNIFTTETARARENPFRSFGDDFFDGFFKDFFPPTNSRRRSLGSGVIINRDGYILTNEHVIGNATTIKVILSDEREFPARIVGSDIKSDLAIIKVEGKENLPYIQMGRSDDLMIGETVIAIGNPFGLQHTVTTGIISALNRSIRGGKNRVYQDFIQLDASINPGNSGGPLLNINGSLIGINTAIYQKAEGIGFAIPIDNAKRIVDDLINYGKVRRGWLGVSVQDLSPELLEHFDMKRLTGVLVMNVVKNSPADRAGILRGDILLSMDQHEVRNRSDFRNRMSTYSIGNRINFTIQRDGREKKARVEVRAISMQYASEFSRTWLGLEAADISKKLARRYRLQTTQGVVVEKVAPNGPSGKIGISPGDVIRQVNQNNVKNQKEFF